MLKVKAPDWIQSIHLQYLFTKAAEVWKKSQYLFLLIFGIAVFNDLFAVIYICDIYMKSDLSYSSTGIRYHGIYWLLKLK